MTWIVSSNPADVTAFQPVAVAYLSVNGLCLLAFIWLYAVHLMEEGVFKPRKDE